MKDNKGMSLVEVLITVTILAIVIISAATFMVTGSKSFARGSASSNVQSEAELALNQVEDLVIDVNGGVEYMVDDAADKEELVMYHVEADDSGVTTYKKRTVTWDRANENLKSSEWNVEYDATADTYVETAEIYKDQLLAENVTAFNVDLSDSYVDTAADGSPLTIVRSVVIRVDCLDGTGSAAYATTPVITLRNRMMKSSSPKEIYNETPAPDDTLVLYISGAGSGGSTPIINRVTEVERDNIYNIFAVVSLGSDVNDQCDWTVEGETPGSSCISTIDASGVLTVSEHEPNEYIVITATYKNNSNKKVVAVVKVTGGSGGGGTKSLDSVKIIPTSLKPFVPNYSSAPDYHGNWSKAEIDAFDYTWTVSEPERVESFENKGKTLGLKVIKEDANYGKVITITLVVHSDVTGQTVSDQVSYRIDSGETKDGSGDSLLERGKVGDVIGYHSDNWYSFEPPFWDPDVKYEYYFCDVNGNRISAHDDLLDCIVISGGHGSYYLSFTEDLPPEREYHIKVIAHYHDQWKGTDWSYERMHTVPAVYLWGETTYCNATVNSGCEFYYNIGGYYELAWANSNPPVYEYEVVDLVYDAPDGVEVTATAAGAQAKTETRIWSRAVFDCSDWSKANSITLKSMTVKINMKGYPDIYTYSTVIFQ